MSIEELKAFASQLGMSLGNCTDLPQARALLCLSAIELS